MAEKRMFTKKITESDAFLEMPASSQNLYFHLNMNADDDGFVNSPRRIMKVVGASEDDIKILISKSFLIPFESGIVVIKHWWMHNTLMKDRYHETDYIEEKNQLTRKENKAYTLSCYQNDNNLLTEIRLDKNRLDKNRESKRFTPPSLEEINAYIKEKNLNVDGSKFYNFFNEGNWIDSKGNKVKSWKQKLLTWDNHNGNNTKQETIPVYKEQDKQAFDEKAFEEIMARR